MMAANAANDGSGRCQPIFVSDDEYREMVNRNRPTPRARPLVTLTLLPKGRKNGQRATTGRVQTVYRVHADNRLISYCCG